MSKFKVGDKIITNASGDEHLPGNITSGTKLTGGYCLVTGYKSNGYVAYDILDSNGKIIGCSHAWEENDFDIFNTYSNTSMSLLTSARNLFLAEPDKTFRKVGIQDDKGNFSDDAKTLFIENLMRTDAAKTDGYLQVTATALLKEQEAEKK